MLKEEESRQEELYITNSINTSVLNQIRSELGGR